MSAPIPAPCGHADRRRLLQAAVLAAGASGLAACDGPLRDPVEADGDGGVGDPDEVLLVAAARDEARMVSLLQALAATGAPRSMRSAVRSTVQVHRAHLGLLDRPQDDEGPGAGARLRVGGVAAAEERLARRHARAALRASSGQFARVLAGMAAAAAQQAELWREVGTRS